MCVYSMMSIYQGHVRTQCPCTAVCGRLGTFSSSMREPGVILPAAIAVWQRDPDECSHVAILLNTFTRVSLCGRRYRSQHRYAAAERAARCQQQHRRPTEHQLSPLRLAQRIDLKPMMLTTGRGVLLTRAQPGAPPRSLLPRLQRQRLRPGPARQAGLQRIDCVAANPSWQNTAAAVVAQQPALQLAASVLRAVSGFVAAARERFAQAFPQMQDVDKQVNT